MSIVCFCSDQSILMTFLELVQPRPIKLTSNTFHSSILFVRQTSDFPEKLSSAFKSSQCVKTTSKRYKSSLFLPVISLKICYVNMLLKFIVGHNWSSSLRELIFKSGQPTPVQQPFRSQVWKSLRAVSMSVKEPAADIFEVRHFQVDHKLVWQWQPGGIMSIRLS